MCGKKHIKRTPRIANRRNRASAFCVAKTILYCLFFTCPKPRAARRETEISIRQLLGLQLFRSKFQVMWPSMSRTARATLGTYASLAFLTATQHFPPVSQLGRSAKPIHLHPVTQRQSIWKKPYQTHIALCGRVIRKLKMQLRSAPLVRFTAAPCGACRGVHNIEEPDLLSWSLRPICAWCLRPMTKTSLQII